MVLTGVGVDRKGECDLGTRGRYYMYLGAMIECGVSAKLVLPSADHLCSKCRNADMQILSIPASACAQHAASGPQGF